MLDKRMFVSISKLVTYRFAVFGGLLFLKSMRRQSQNTYYNRIIYL